MVLWPRFVIPNLFPVSPRLLWCCNIGWHWGASDCHRAVCRFRSFNVFNGLSFYRLKPHVPEISVTPVHRSTETTRMSSCCAILEHMRSVVVSLLLVSSGLIHIFSPTHADYRHGLHGQLLVLFSGNLELFRKMNETDIGMKTTDFGRFEEE